MAAIDGGAATVMRSASWARLSRLVVFAVEARTIPYTMQEMVKEVTFIDHRNNGFAILHGIIIN